MIDTNMCQVRYKISLDLLRACWIARINYTNAVFLWRYIITHVVYYKEIVFNSLDNQYIGEKSFHHVFRVKNHFNWITLKRWAKSCSSYFVFLRLLNKYTYKSICLKDYSCSTVLYLTMGNYSLITATKAFTCCTKNVLKLNNCSKCAVESILKMVVLPCSITVSIFKKNCYFRSFFLIHREKTKYVLNILFHGTKLLPLVIN